MLKEFKEFAVKGNVMDMAVGIIVGVAFGKIVSSFVGDIVMPPIGVMMGGVNFTDLAFVLQEAVGETAAVAINYGKFVQTIIDFVIVAGAVFVAVKTINSMKKVEEAPEEPEAEPEPSKEEVLLSEIRDLLKARN
ncbi:large-conductance mechanosensitive channel protein MscL [Neptunomonas japonica]|uniref:large-conductance mechanosensitive channel protein MscL n=1 Tax=Neptunomonas japonica TaxID=417574 RepID=UPI000418775F